MRTVTISLLFVVCIFVVACSSSQAKLDAQATQTAEASTVTPTLLTDAEFTEAAREVCSTLKVEISDSYSYASMAQGYRHAAVNLSELEITEQSAPQGFLLRFSLLELANTCDVFDTALSEALNRANIEGAYKLWISESGEVLAAPAGARDIFEEMKNTKHLDIEEELVLKLIETRTVLRDAAISLGLEDCAKQE